MKVRKISGESEDTLWHGALARAWQWQEELESGKYSGVEELARAKKVDRSYAGRLLKLTSLAPEIVEALLAGQGPEGLSLRQLRRGIPLSWEDQRELWDRGGSGFGRRKLFYSSSTMNPSKL